MDVAINWLTSFQPTSAEARVFTRVSIDLAKPGRTGCGHSGHYYEEKSPCSNDYSSQRIKNNKTIKHDKINISENTVRPKSEPKCFFQDTRSSTDSMTVEKTLIEGVKNPYRIFDRGTKPYWRRYNPEFARLRNVKGLSRSDINVAHSWVQGLLSIEVCKTYPIPHEVAKLLREIRPSVYAVSTRTSHTDSRELITFLYRSKAKICNIFGSLVDACKRGDPVLALMRGLRSNSYQNRTCRQWV